MSVALEFNRIFEYDVVCMEVSGISDIQNLSLQVVLTNFAEKIAAECRKKHVNFQVSKRINDLSIDR